MIIGNMVWPALYVSAKLSHFYYLVLITIVIETLLINYFLKFTIAKSAMISLVVNLFSSIIGTFILVFLMLFYHMIADMIVGPTFSLINWIATYIIMLLGSVLIEVLIAGGIWKVKIKDLLVPLMMGNLITYSIIAFVNVNIQV